MNPEDIDRLSPGTLYRLAQRLQKVAGPWARAADGQWARQTATGRSVALAQQLPANYPLQPDCSWQYWAEMRWPNGYTLTADESSALVGADAVLRAAGWTLC